MGYDDQTGLHDREPTAIGGENLYNEYFNRLNRDYYYLHKK